MTSLEKEHVVITGIGVLSPLGLGKQATLASLREGRCGIRFGDARDVFGAGFWPAYYGVCEGFEPASYGADEKSLRGATRSDQLAVSAARLALEDADWARAQRAERNASSAGTLLASASDDALDAFYFLPPLQNTAAEQIAIEHAIKGLSYSVVNVANGGAVAIGEAYRAIRNGRAKRMVTGAARGPLGAYASLEKEVLDRHLSSTENGSRAFSRETDGIILGEGAAILVLEAESAARARGAHIYAEIKGYANAYAPRARTIMDKQAGYVRAMRATLAAAELAPAAISTVNASGIGLRAEDAAEAGAVREVFGERVELLPISGTKAQTGYIEIASSALEIAVAALSIDEDLLPPTVRLGSSTQDPDLDYVPERGRTGHVEHVLSMSYDPCGSNVGLIISKHES